MRSASKHIASLLLACFLIGGVAMPWLHQLQHALGFFADTHSHSHTSHHEHPDHDGVNASSLHEKDHELSCVLCSFVVWDGIFNIEQDVIPDARTAHVALFVSALFLNYASISIRGPPIG